jgi:hypothetical protein
MVSQMLRHPKVLLIAIAFSIGAALSLSQHVSRAQDADRPAIAPQPCTINLTQEQRFIIKENVKDLGIAKAPKDAPETIGDPVPTNIVLHALPLPTEWPKHLLRPHGNCSCDCGCDSLDRPFIFSTRNNGETRRL